MDEMTIKTQQDLVLKYICAKDKNRPHLMDEVFANNATLEMKLKTQNISFPSQTVGLDNITEVLVTKFSQSYENVHTFCLTDTMDNASQILKSDWIVCMQEKRSGDIRIGYGVYNWFFTQDDEPLVKHLTIQIEEMITMEEEYSMLFFDWVRKLDYPLCSLEQLFKKSPNFRAIKSVQKYFREK